MHPHLAGDMSQDHMAIFQLDPESCVGQVFNHLALHLDHIVPGHTAKSVANGSFEVSLFQQRFILLRHHVVLHLGHEVHGDHHNDQKRRAAKVKRYVPLEHHKFRQQTDQRDVDRPHQGQAHQNLVNEACGLIARANARNQGARLLQVVCGFFAVKHERCVKKAEKDDRGGVQGDIKRLPR